MIAMKSLLTRQNIGLTQKLGSISLRRSSHHEHKKPIKVLVTGAAGQIGYSILPRLARGDVWGKEQPVVLKMFDLTVTESIMKGVAMELEDCAFKALSKVEVHTQAEPAFSDCDVIVMLANAMELKSTITRAQLLKENLRVYNQTAEYLRKNANKDVKILMIANPANTNTLLLIEKLKGVLPAENLTCLTCLDHNRTKSMLAAHFNVPNDYIRKIVVWGNHSATMVPDVRFAEVKTSSGWVKASSLLKDPEWINQSLIPNVRDRVNAIIRARGKSSSLSAANAGIDHLRCWLVGTDPDDWVSMGVYTKPLYSAIPEGVVFGQPCRCENGKFKVVEGLEIDPQTHKLMEASGKELLTEKSSVLI